LRWEWRKIFANSAYTFSRALPLLCVLRASSLLNVNYEGSAREKRSNIQHGGRLARAREETRRRLLLARYSRIPMMLLLEFFTPRGES
jgi:hypothetical protein